MWPSSDRARPAALAAALLLAACASGPDFVPPAIRASDAYTREPLSDLASAGGELDAGHPAPPDWWTLFSAPRLDQTVRVALQGNRSLAAAQASLAEAAQLAHASTAGLYPQVDLDAGAGREKLGAASLGNVYFPAFSYYSIGPVVSYTLDYTGGVHRAVEAQYAQLDMQRCELEAARLSLAGNVALAALRVAAARAEIGTVRDLLREDAKNLDYVRQSFDAGSVSRVDVLSAQTQLANDQTLLPPLEQQLSIARHQLSVLAGRAPADWAPPEFELAEFKALQQLPLTLPSQLVRRRPDILAAEARLHAATASLGVATANLYPQVTLSAGLSLQSTTPRQLFEASSLVGNIAAGLVAPVFDHGALRDRRGAAQQEVRAALDRYEQTVLESFAQVADVLDALDHDAQMEQAQERAVDAASNNLELARESYSAGNSGVLQVLDAQRADEQAQLGLVRVRAQRLQDQIQLLLATGGVPPSPDMAAAPRVVGTAGAP